MVKGLRLPHTPKTPCHCIKRDRRGNFRKWQTRLLYDGSLSHQRDCYRLWVISYNSSDPSGGGAVGVPEAILRHYDRVAGHATSPQLLSWLWRATTKTEHVQSWRQLPTLPKSTKSVSWKWHRTDCLRLSLLLKQSETVLAVCECLYIFRRINIMLYSDKYILLEWSDGIWLNLALRHIQFFAFCILVTKQPHAIFIIGEIQDDSWIIIFAIKAYLHDWFWSWAICFRPF